ncbi:MAG: hypothetical protein KGJ30_20715, partial [Burkholderiales bacterium]|nr:hypothetical protein [Burkholderiales bacterium]
AVFFVPIFFVVVRGLFKGSERQRRLYAHEAEAMLPLAPPAPVPPAPVPPSPPPRAAGAAGAAEDAR